MKSININAVIDPFILEKGTEIRLRKGQQLTQQFAKATDFYLLKTGKVCFYISLSDSGEEIKVGESSAKLTPIGWSGFNAPGRYATTVKVDSTSATFIKWKHHDLTELFRSHPDDGTIFLRDICGRARHLIQIATNILGEHSPTVHQPEPEVEAEDEYQLTEIAQDEEFVKFLRKSSFFEVFEEAPLEFLSQSVERRIYRPNDNIYLQDSAPDGIYILALGKVRFSYQSHHELTISFRQVSTPGFVVGWSGAVGMPNIINAHAVQETAVYFVPKQSLERILKLHPRFAPEFYRRLLWLIGHQLQAIRTRIIASKFNHEIVAIGNLIDQNSARLDLSSPIHKIPHLLEDKVTVGDALKILEQLKEEGTTLEKNISITSLDILEEIRKEHQFYTGLVKVYTSVIKAPGSADSDVVRKINAQAYQELFEQQDYVVSGVENLPEESGNIFIYNHLRNHPYNTLPNQFQITLDSHFISAMILMKKYGDPGLRIVRVGLSKEYAHQEYYQRLGHIDVFTDDSDENSKKVKKQVRQRFYSQAGEHLAAGGNLIISPEGNSYSTDETPGPFKPGAFNLALSLKKEPWIVPIAFANFDKRVRNNRFSCAVMPAFKISEFIKDPANKDAMKQFLKNYQITYRQYVDLAIAQSKKN